MTIELPAPIADYFDSDRSTDLDAIPRRFTEEATVEDEGRTYVGHEAIRRWKAASSRKYRYTAEPFAVEEEAALTIVTVHLVGDFPGSPIDLRYRFALEGDRIAALEIGV